MPQAQLTFPAIDLLALAFLAGFGVATLVFVPLLRREHRRGGRAAARSRRRVRPEGTALSARTSAPAPPPPEPQAEPPSPPRSRAAVAESDAESTLPDGEAGAGKDDDTSAGTITEHSTVGAAPSRWHERVELCAAKHRVRFGQAQARLLSISDELELD
ncbi:hypothetical protein CDG81_05515 [Actinopolyspora erythraea]|uniref:Uncharacterized protein n=1 Tax=Actinopolyspora erythraea TaxID=414996 RepID=A0A099D0U3_9ACTN|nr:hypothetical protein [Actinopolyspora erythraea]ASU77859.1 hypothetical protein CDG81_05515 [Actinopolyspora erythraea]KGI79848.1 hypothetical protein IL38_20510 [Actinopolyspora erythraea]